MEVIQKSQTESQTKHWRDWPNAAAFNATGETRSRVPVKITGTFPPYVAGSLLRTGPGSYKVPRKNENDGQFAVDHWFDGFTTVHKFELVADEDGKCSEVWYSSRSHADGMIEDARKTGKLPGVTFGQKRDPCDSLYKKIKTAFVPGSGTLAPNIGVTMRLALPAEMARKTEKIDGGKLMSLTTDNHETRLFETDTLEPFGITQNQHLHPELKGVLSAAHASIDPKTGDIFNYNLAFSMFPTYRVFRASPSTGEVEILATIADRDVPGAYIHSISLTENFVVLCVWPAFFTKAGISILWSQNLMEAFAPFNPKAKTTWYVIDRKRGRGVVKKFTSHAMFSFHTTNAWEEAGASVDTVDIVCELYEHKNMDILTQLYYKNMVSDESNVAAFRKKRLDGREHGGLARYKLANIPIKQKPAASAVWQTADRILYMASPSSGDLPRYNPEFACKPHRYVWSVLNRGKSSFLDGLCKTDTQTQSAIVWEQERHTPGEPIFVADPQGRAEDDGVILTVVFDGDSGSSYLLCLDARSLVELGRADVGMPVGLGFHGIHMAANL